MYVHSRIAPPFSSRTWNEKSLRRLQKIVNLVNFPKLNLNPVSIAEARINQLIPDLVKFSANIVALLLPILHACSNIERQNAVWRFIDWGSHWRKLWLFKNRRIAPFSLLSTWISLLFLPILAIKILGCWSSIFFFFLNNLYMPSFSW
jgi:hypothetical protein